MLKAGMIIGERYEIIEKIGTGGMSDVYKAKCHKLNRFVAIKVLKSEFSENKSFVSKFRVEAQAAAGLAHPNIVNVYDVGEENGMHYIVMELVEGITLKEYIEKKARLSVKEAISIAIQISMGIEAAHNNHIIHRDIKPQNIIISREGKVKVTDFGIARAATTNTITSNVMGSVHYTSPEQARGGYSDEKSDIYSLGITMFEMLTGRVPFNGETTVAIAIKHIQDAMPSPREYVPEIPVSVEQIIFKCTQKSPDRRYLTMADLITDLKKSLMNPDEDFVQLAGAVGAGETKLILDEDVEEIRKGRKTIVRTAVLHEAEDEEDEEEEEYDEEDEEYEEEYESEDDDLNPKMEKIITVLGILAAAIIVTIALALVGKALGVFKSAPKPDSNNQIEAEAEEDDNNTGNKVKVPNVVGMSIEKAKETLNELGLGFAQDGTTTSDAIEKGCVAEQSEEAGTEVEKNTTIKVIISTGINSFTIPDVKNIEEAEAKKRLDALDLSVTVNYEYSSSIEEGNVISTKPEAGAEVKKGDSVTMAVSRGAEVVNVTVPDVRGKTEEAAKLELTELGLVVGVVTQSESDTVQAGHVIEQTYAPGVSLEPGRMIDLIVSTGPKPKPEQVYRSTVIVAKPEGFTGGWVKFELTQVVNGSEVSTSIIEGQLDESSFPYTLQMTGASGVTKGVVTIYVDGEELKGTYNVVFTPQ